MKTAAIYVRISTDKQNESSLSEQATRCRAWAKAHGHRVAATYSDEAQSGATLHRAGLQRLLADATGAKWAAVLVADMTRLSRDTEGTLTVVRQLKEAGADVVDCTTGVSTSDPGSKLQTIFSGYLGEQFRAAISVKTTDAMTARAERGEWTGGRCLGFDTVRIRPGDEKSPKVPTINKKGAAIVRRIFKEYADGAGLRTISDGLNKDGVTAPYDKAGLGYSKKAGRGWQHTTIRAMLRNERYRGVFRWNLRAFVKPFSTGKRVSRIRPQAEHKVTKNPKLAIIDAQTWAKVQASLAAHAVNFGRPQVKRNSKPAPLSTLVKCGTCGGPMSLSGTSHSGRSYRCSTFRSKGVHGPCPNNRSIQEARVLEFVGETARLALEAKRGSAAYKDFEKSLIAADAARSKRPNLAALDSAVRAARARVEKVGSTLLAIGVSDFLREQLQEAEKELAGRVAERAAANMPTTTSGAWFPSPTIIKGLWVDLRDNLLAGDPWELGPYLRQRIAAVVVSPAVAKDDSVSWAMQLQLRLPGAENSGESAESCGGGI